MYIHGVSTDIFAVNPIGRPIVTLAEGSIVTISPGATLISASWATALGVAHPIVLRTLRPGASIYIGHRVGISGGSICAAASVRIGDDTLLGADVTIADTDFHTISPLHRRGHAHPDIAVRPVSIGSRVFIGTGSIVLKGVSVGDNTVIGAKSVVLKDIPPNVIAAGNPCRVIRPLTPAELSGKP